MKYEDGEFIFGEHRVSVQNVVNALYNIENYFTQVKRDNQCAKDPYDTKWPNLLKLKNANIVFIPNGTSKHALSLEGDASYFDVVGISVAIRAPGIEPVISRQMKSWPTPQSVIAIYRDCAEKTTVPYELLCTQLKFNAPSLFTLASNVMFAKQLEFPTLKDGELEKCTFSRRTEEHFKQNRYTFNMLEHYNSAYYYLYGSTLLSENFVISKTEPQCVINWYSELLRFGRSDLAFHLLPFINAFDRDRFGNNIIILLQAAPTNHSSAYINSKIPTQEVKELASLTNIWGVNAYHLSQSRTRLELQILHSEIGKESLRNFKGHVFTAITSHNFTTSNFLLRTGAKVVPQPNSYLINIYNPTLFLIAQYHPFEEFSKFYNLNILGRPHRNEHLISFKLGACLNEDPAVLPFLVKVFDIKQFSENEAHALIEFVKHLIEAEAFGGIAVNLAKIYSLLSAEQQIIFFIALLQHSLRYRDLENVQPYIHTLLQSSIKLILENHGEFWNIYAYFCDADELIFEGKDNRFFSIICAYLNLNDKVLVVPEEPPFSEAQFLNLLPILRSWFNVIGCDTTKMNLPALYNHFTDQQQIAVFQTLVKTALVLNDDEQYEDQDNTQALPGIINFSKDIILKISAQESKKTFWQFICRIMAKMSPDRVEKIAEFLISLVKTGIAPITSANPTPLHCYLQKAEESRGPKMRQLIESLLDLHDVNVADIEGDTLLHLFIKTACYAIFDPPLSKHGPDEKYIDDHISWVKKILCRVNDINRPNKSLETPFYTLISEYTISRPCLFFPRKVFEIISLLLDAGALAHITPPGKESILELAASNSNRLLYFIISSLHTNQHCSTWQSMIDPNHFSAEQIQLHEKYFEKWLNREPEKPIHFYQGKSWNSNYIYVCDEETQCTALSYYGVSE